MGWVGRSPTRSEDRALVDGLARFAGDVEPIGGALHAAIVRSPVARGRLVALHPGGVESDTRGKDRGAALVTAADIDFTRPVPNILTDRVSMPLLAIDRVSYVGEPLAVALADTRDAAMDLACSIEPEIETGPACAGLDFAVLGPPIHDVLDSNVVHERTFRYTPDAAPGDADQLSIAHDAVMPRSTALPLERVDITADFDPGSGRYTVWANYGGPMALHAVMASCLGVAPADLRLHISERIGGNFGIKQAMYPMIALVAAAARVVGRPVRWRETRAESLTAASAASERRTIVTGGFGRDGKLHSLAVEQTENLGAYVRTPEPAGLYRMHGAITGPYDVQDLVVANRAVLTNQVPSGLNRGFGAPQLFLSLESMIDRAARELELDRAEIRRRNVVGAFPHRCPGGAELDSGDYVAVIDRACELIGWSSFDRATSGTRRRGIGLACSVETSGNNLGYMNLAADPDSPAARVPRSGAGAVAAIAIDPVGSVTVHLDAPDCGQGYRTIAAQVAADELGVDPEAIRVETALDTASDGWLLTSGNYANRFSTAVASAVAEASRKAAEKLRHVAAARLGTTPDLIDLVEGQAIDRTSGASTPVLRLGGQLHWDLAQRPTALDGPIRESAYYAPGHLRSPEAGALQTSFTYSFQCDAAIVQVDPATGELAIESYVSVHDAGTVLHPASFVGQVHGGLAHGLGAALGEEIAYDEDGRPSATSLHSYAPLRATRMPPVVVDHLESPSPHTVHGAKGIGDGCAVLAPAVLASAIGDALELARNPTPPFTPARVWELAVGLGSDR